MKRGLVMPRGMEFAVPVALKRGHVMVFIRSLLNLGEFLITGNGIFILVGIRFARRLYASLSEIEAEFMEVITGLRLIPRTGPVSCELWLYSRYGTLRHFRIGDAGLVEIDCYGTPLDQLKPVSTGTMPAGSDVPIPGASTAAGQSDQETPDKRGPILRWLAKWNAARLEGRKVDTEGSSELKKILDTGGPGTKGKRSSGKKPVKKKPAEAGSAKNSLSEVPDNENPPASSDGTFNKGGDQG